MTTLRLNLRSGAITQYGAFTFTSLCTWNGLQIGAGPEGIFQLNVGQKDVYTLTSDERPISAWFELPTTQLGSDKVKQGRRLYVGGEFNGPMTVKCTTGSTNNTYDITPRYNDYTQHTLQVPMSHLQKGEYWGFVVANVAGSDFSVDSIDGTFVNVNRRFGL